jgi:glycerate 2-kinase
MSQHTRNLARQIFAEAMAATTVDAACARALSLNGTLLTAGPHTYDLATFNNILIISIGKAGATLFDAVRSILPPNLPIRSLISAPFPPQHLDPNTQYFQGGHPLPNAASIQAAEAALTLLATADANTLVLFLISGGASAMFESPIHPTLTLPDLISLNRQLVASGAPVDRINAVRKHLSAVKGGRLAAAAPLATKLTLLISDVPTQSLDALASGPTLPDTTTLADCLQVIETSLSPSDLPTSIRTLLPTLDETPKPHHPAFANASHHVLLDNAALLEATSIAAQRLGFTVTIDNTCDDWDYEAAATYLLNRSADLAHTNARSCLLSGGEVTVKLPANPGSGGRNQQLALFAAQSLTNTTLLSAGSDGIDGNSPAAGCVADETTLPRAQALNLNPATFLARFDATPFFAALGDTLVTGPSGNNLRDIRILLTGGDA